MCYTGFELQKQENDFPQSTTVQHHADSITRGVSLENYLSGNIA